MEKKTIYGNQKWGKIQQKYDFLFTYPKPWGDLRIKYRLLLPFALTYLMVLLGWLSNLHKNVSIGGRVDTL